MPDRITSTYLHALQSIYCDIGDRGICVDIKTAEFNKQKIRSLINQQLAIASAQWGCFVFVGADNAPDKKSTTFQDSVNLNATKGERALLDKLIKLGYKVPKIAQKNSDGDYETRFSTAELALQKMLAENQFNYPGGDPAIRAILKVRELAKVLSVYLNARLVKRGDSYYFLCSYNVVGTLTLRRASRKHTYGFGNNSQNFPKHSDVAAYFRECLVPRPGNVFLFVDQIQAEEWPVSALSQNYTAIAELESQKDPNPELRIDRHSKLASAIFDEVIPPKASKAWNKQAHELKRYLGKKIKHARNYGMRPPRMQMSLAQEGISVSLNTCTSLLAKAAQLDPTVDTIFHAYIKEQLTNTKTLVGPFGWDRLFIGARPNADNSTLFNEAYSWIPQHTVGANTGFAVFDLETDSGNKNEIVQEGHDSIVQDIPFTEESILFHIDRIRQAFDRKIRFHNGVEINIPIEASIGFDFNDEIVLDNLNRASLRKAIDKLNEKREKREKEKNDLVLV